MQIITDKKPLVSVIIDTYNYGRFIEEAIDSVLNQTFPQKDLEIIVVDDGSTDDTAQRVKKYKNKINYIYKENGGQASAFNAGFENAQGEIIAFLDSDDYWVPHKLEVIAQRFERSAAVDFVFHNLELVDGQRNFIRLYFDSPEHHVEYKRFNLDDYLKGTIPLLVGTSGLAARSRCLKNIMPVPNDYRTSADGYIMYFAPFYAKEYFLIKEPLCYYRIHGDNLSGTYDKVKSFAIAIKFYKMVIKDIEKYGQHNGLDVSLLIKEFERWITNFDHEIRCETSLSYKVKSFFKSRYRLIKNEGLGSYFRLFYNYRKKLITNWAKRKLSAL